LEIRGNVEAWAAMVEDQGNIMTYTINIEPSRSPGKVTGTSSDEHRFTASEPLLNGARYWQALGAPSSATIIAVWSSGPGHWSLRSTIGHAAKLAVKGDHFRLYRGE
jgi:hypothetical protein